MVPRPFRVWRRERLLAADHRLPADGQVGEGNERTWAGSRQTERRVRRDSDRAVGGD